jgi:hypothetical protein
VLGLFIFVGIFAVLGCGGGGGGGTAKHSLGGTVSGLTGSGLVLHSSLGDDLAVAADGAFAFPTTVAEGAAYEVTVKQQPTTPQQTCVVTNGSGTMGTADVTSVAVACSTASPRFTVGGAVSGLTGSGLVLQNNSGDDLAVTGDGPFTFAGTAPAGASYAVTVKTQPGDPAQLCEVTNGGGTIGSANVTNVAVTCRAVVSSFTVGGVVIGLAPGGAVVLRNNGGDSLTRNANGSFTFSAPVSTGGAYAVTVFSKPETQSCVVSNGTGTMGSSAVINVLVTCTNNPPNTFAVGGTVSGLGAGKSLVLRNASVDTTITANGPYTLDAPVATGVTYAVAVATQPVGQTCTVANANGTIASSAVTNVNVSCVVNSTAIQQWAAPTSWGALWPDSPTMVQHAFFDGTQLVERKGVQWTVEGAPAPELRELAAFPGAPRFGAGPFATSHYEATGGDSGFDFTGDMLVCAIVKPDYNPVDGSDPVIIAKGFDRDQPPGRPSGWVLVQSDHMFNFQYRYVDGTNNFSRMAYAPTYFADESRRDNGPLNPSYVAVCAGRDGDTLRLATNSTTGASNTELIPVPGAPLHTGAAPAPLTIGGYSNGDAAHAYGGRIYETAIWAEPATPANMQAKLSAFLALADGAQYARNREASFFGPDGALHTAWRNAPRYHLPDGTGLGGGLLFGLQGWNRVTALYTPPPTDTSQQNAVVAIGEDLSHALWTKSGGAVAEARQLAPPGDSEQPTAARVTLPPGAALTAAHATFDTAGPIHGMVWVRPVSASGTLRIETSQPAAGGASRHDVDLAALRPGEWNYVWLAGLTTNASAGTVSLSNPGTADVEFFGWGLALTQIGRGGDLGSFDPGPAMYDWSGAAGGADVPRDQLELPKVPASTAATGFCLTVDAQPPAGLAWNAPFVSNRAALTWRSLTTSDIINVFVGGTSNTSVPVGNLCVHVSTLTGGTLCLDPAAQGWAPGSKHTIGVCSTAAGVMTLHADGALVATKTTSGGVPPDLADGRLIVGNNGNTGATSVGTWQGFISRAAACPAGDVASCL